MIAAKILLPDIRRGLEGDVEDQPNKTALKNSSSNVCNAVGYDVMPCK